MLDILQLRFNPEELDRLRLCQAAPRSDCHAAFTVKGPQTIWPMACWDEIAAAEQINVRGWFPLLDKMADEFLIWRPQGGCFFVYRDRVTYRAEKNNPRNVLFLQLEMNRLTVVPPRPAQPVRALLAQSRGLKGLTPTYTD
ncbi:MAG: hypothetical protein ABSG84_08325 [Acidobacteriaceae bacterium]